MIAWNHQAELIENCVKKGQEIAIEGKLTTRSYEDQKGIMDYCLEDVLLTEKLFYKQCERLEKLDTNFLRIIQQATFHGRSMGIAAQIETNGIPINNNLYDNLQEHYPMVFFLI